MAIAGRKDSNPSAVYLMLLQVIPPVELPVPMIGMPYLFVIDNYLLLSFCILAPAALRIMRSKDKAQVQGLDMVDFCLLAYGLLTAILYVHTETPDGGIYPGSITESMRRGFVFLFGIFIPYFALSRINSGREKLVDSMATFCLACAVMAAIAVLESAHHWLLYGEMAGRWGYGLIGTPYLARGTSLRAMASSGHSMALGHLFVVAFGFSLYLLTRVDSKRSRIGVTALFWAGLMAAYARGAWIGGVLVYFLFALLRPNPLSKFLKATGIAAVVTVLAFLSPLGDKIVSVLPFLGGHVDNFNVVYRQRLWDRSWQVIQESPIWGDPAAMLKMQDLRQGEGIIDLVNSYVQILLDNGFVGLSLFLTFILILLLKAWSSSRQAMRADPDFGLLGASLVSCIVATLVVMENGSFVGVSQRLFYVIAALAGGYAYLGRARQRDPHLRQLAIGNKALPR
jgi:O-antigen ligase